MSFDSKAFLAHLTPRPGVYRMYNSDNELLYVGKAKNLKNRVSSYFRSRGLNNKTVALVSHIHHIEIAITHSETEALLLEQTLIKQHRPPYNIMLMDDKSYPYLFISDNHKSPGIYLHRGSKKRKGSYFGPYPNVAAVKESMALLQQAFKLRQCEDSIFENRSRPCLQYQIKRCKAPCVDLVDESEYLADVDQTKRFLNGKNNELIPMIEVQMDEAVAKLDFERAAEKRDQLLLLRRVQEQQFVAGKQGNVDVFALCVEGKGQCIHYMQARDGRILGSRSFFPKQGIEDEPGDILMAFLAQYYIGSKRADVPNSVVVSHEIAEQTWLEEAIFDALGKKLSIQSSPRGVSAKWLSLAHTNAKEQLAFKSSHASTINKRYQSLMTELKLDAIPNRMECFDISHSHGEATVASCVVFDKNGPAKSHYRTFNIEGVTAGDDFAAMKQAIERRYSRLLKEQKNLPDILIVDGGKGQLNMAKQVLEQLAIHDITLLGVAKGVTRKAGFETLYLNDIETEVKLENHSPALHLIQHIRDESHRFAISKHRAKRDKSRPTSLLDQIDGIGPAKKKALLRHFGSVKAMQSESLDAIAKVEGISKKLAQSIHDALHSH